MNANSLLFLLGIILVQQFTRLPTVAELVGLACSLVICFRRAWWLFTFILGLLWGSIYAGWRMSEQLPDAYDNQIVTVRGYITSLPQRQDNRVSFDFRVSEPSADFPDKVRLTWYYPQMHLAAGQGWEMQVKLRKPHGRLNPGGFEFEAWLFANHIGATGYVRDKSAPTAIAVSPSLGLFFSQGRQAIADRLDAALPNSEQLGIIKALTIGSQNAISQAQWQVFRATGVVHLIVISGSHISLIAGLVYVWIRRVWAWTGILSIAPQRAAALISWLAALFYAGLAGYSIPTVRALVMLSVALAAISWQRHAAPMQILLLALLAVLLFDPLAVLSVGFWLSFCAVALLIYVSVGRLGRANYWREATMVQWATALGLSPLLVVFFQQVSLIAPVANWLAVPVIGLLVVPLALVAVGLLFIWSSGAEYLLQFLDYILQGLWWCLERMSDLPFALLVCRPPSGYGVGIAGLGVVLMLAPRGFPGRYLAPLFFLPLVFVVADKPKPGEVWLTLLDVGQGLSALVQTAEHALVYDTGARFSEYADMGDSVVVPFIRQQGVAKIDTLVISHDDIDHSGGADTVMRELPVEKVLSSVARWAELPGAQYCSSGQSWYWDNVEFRVLSPPPSGFNSENDNSCVLQIKATQRRFLLTGDIEQAAENWLVQNYAEQLASEVMLAPHHGSKSSSGMAFLQRVNPELILIPAGYQNRFGFPHQSVIDRYRRLGIAWLNSAEQGAITLGSANEASQPISERVERQRYWRTPPPDPDR